MKKNPLARQARKLSWLLNRQSEIRRLVLDINDRVRAQRLLVQRMMVRERNAVCKSKE